MTRVLADALVPIFTGLLLGYWAGRRELMDSINIRNLIVFVMTFSAPCALFSIIIGTSREVLQQQVMTVFAIALVFTGIYLGCYFWARYRVGMSIPNGAVLALTFRFPKSQKRLNNQLRGCRRQYSRIRSIAHHTHTSSVLHQTHKMVVGLWQDRGSPQ
jgi:glucan phosphoethanolaminetransferase (alkaline phosphatase superfamily)